MAEQAEWALGERIVNEAFRYVPNTHHKVLWEAKMNFLSKLGKNELSAISNMKESSASLMAKVWVRLARSSQQELEQHQAYNKAIEILRKEESIEVVEVLVEYAEWLHRRNYPAQDVEDQLLAAVDTMMDVEPGAGWGDDDDEELAVGGNDDDEKKSKHTAKTGQSKASKVSRAMTKKSKTRGSAIGGKTVRSKMSKSAMRSRTMRTAASRVSKKTTTSLSRRQEEDGHPTFLNCAHFDKLVRIHSTLGLLSLDAGKQREFALDGHFFVMRMWEQSFASLNAQAFFEAHQAEVAELGFRAGDPASRREFLAEVLTSGDLTVPTRFVLPERAEDWHRFELPAEFG